MTESLLVTVQLVWSRFKPQDGSMPAAHKAVPTLSESRLPLNTNCL